MFNFLTAMLEEFLRWNQDFMSCKMFNEEYIEYMEYLNNGGLALVIFVMGDMAIKLNSDLIYRNMIDAWTS